MKLGPLARPFARVALATAALTAPLHAQDWHGGSGRLEGRVLDDKGQPLAGAHVKLELKDRGGTQLTTDARGRWAILGLSGGPWAIELAADGFVTRRVDVSVSEQERRPALEVRLQPRLAGGASAEEQLLLARAESAQKERRFADARRAFGALLALRPDLGGRIHQQIGFSWIEEKDYPQALESLRRALVADPDDLATRVAAVQAAFESDRPDDARALLGGLDPARVESGDVAFSLGARLVNAGAAREAIPWLGRSIALDPKAVDGYYRRALAHLQLGENGDSRADFRRVVELAPDTPEGQLAQKALEQVK